MPAINNLAANEIAFAARKPGPPNTDEPTPRKPLSKLGISDKPDPINELPNPGAPKEGNPNPELPKPATAKRASPKFTIERPEEKDENDEKCVVPRIFGEKRLELNPKPAERTPGGVARPTPKDENPETPRPDDSLLREFPKERHWPSVRPALPRLRAISVPPARFIPPNDRHPPPAFSEGRAEASIDRLEEFPNPCHFPDA
jgi:hypothetical protein